ncbi:MAG: cell division protein SepF [Eubacteriales bacterium]|nr:cell division protein SepF [Lachnospiraceae bacterium]MDO5127720.1 cell division protein SepF [Eubacteriales bacterium]
MAKEAGKKSFLDFFKMKDLDDDEFDDDLFDDDDEDEDDYDYAPRRNRNNNRSNQKQVYGNQGGYQPTQASYTPVNKQPVRGVTQQSGKLVDFNNSRQPRTESYRGKSEVYVIKPQEISESQTVTDFLKNGKTIVINMEGVELAPAQRIIDFIGGACYALNGSLQAISANIFIAAPDSIEVSGDLREEILNESMVSPQLGRY